MGGREDVWGSYGVATTERERVRSRWHAVALDLRPAAVRLDSFAGCFMTICAMRDRKWQQLFKCSIVSIAGWAGEGGAIVTTTRLSLS